MASWKQESEVYKTRMYEKYGIIEEKFDKQAFNNDPIAYFESINYELHGTEWISAMWNLLKFAHTDSKFIKKQLGPNGQKASQILCKILLKNKALGQKVEAKMKETPDYSMADTVLQENNLLKYDRLLDEEILNEGRIANWWKGLTTGKKIGIIVGIIAIILAIVFSIGVSQFNSALAQENVNVTFWQKVQFIAENPGKIFGVGLKGAGQGIANAAKGAWDATGGALINSIKNGQTQRTIAKIAQKGAEDPAIKAKICKAIGDFFGGNLRIDVVGGKEVLENVLSDQLVKAVNNGFDLSVLAM